MNIRIRLLRKPLTTFLWLLLTALMSAFLLVGFSLWFSTFRLAENLDKNTIAVAVRSDQALLSRGKAIVPEERYFTQKDKAYLESLNSVKAVRSHTLSGAVIPQLTPVLEMNRYKSYEAAGNPLPYCNAVIVGTYVQKVHATPGNPIQMTFEVKDILLIGEEYERCRAAERLKETGAVTVVTLAPYDDDGIVTWETDPDIGFGFGFGWVTWFEEGRTYVLAGYYDPGFHLINAAGELMQMSGNSQVLYMNELQVRDGMLWGFNRRKIPAETWIQEQSGTQMTGTFSGSYMIEAAEDYALPAAELWEDDPQRFFEETPHDAWRTYRDVWEKQQHSLPVIGTEHLESMYAFMADRAKIREGRSFTEEEYESGAKVLILSQMLADQCGVKVGDKLSLTQYLSCFGDYGEISDRTVGMRAGQYYNDPSVDIMNLNQDYGAPEEEFTVVGTYELLSAWTYGPYDFGPNTLFIPKKAQIGGAFGEIPETEEGTDIYGLLLSVELVNGRMDEFMTQIEGSDYEQQFFAFDQGVEGALKNIKDMTSSMERLFYMSAFGWLLFLLLYLLMFQGAERQTLGSMRSLGEPVKRTAGYLFGGGFLVALGGVFLGTAAGALVLRTVQQGILRDALAGLDQAMEAEALAAAEEKLITMHASSNLTPMQLLLLAAGQLLILTIALLLHAAVLSRRHPRHLMEG